MHVAFVILRMVSVLLALLSGTELWSYRHPADARSTSVAYTPAGRQFIVVAAGGHGGIIGSRDDSAFTLP